MGDPLYLGDIGFAESRATTTKAFLGRRRFGFRGWSGIAGFRVALSSRGRILGKNCRGARK
jgi:hypothetical protein